jgi:outer membrane protein
MAILSRCFLLRSVKKMKKCLIVLAALIIGVSANAFAAGDAKIGYLDSQSAAIQSQWGKKIAENIKHETQKLQTELEEKSKTLKTAYDEFEKKKDVMDQKAKDKKQKELQEMFADGQKQASDASAKLQDMRAQALKPIYEKMREIVEKIGKDEKYTVILEKSNVHYIGNDKDDLTKRVAGELDKSTPK